MIGQHPALFQSAELKLFASPTVGEMEASLPRFWIERGITRRSPGLVRALAEYLFGGQDIGALAAARTWLADRQGLAGGSRARYPAGAHQPAHRGGKSPENAASDEALGRLAEAYHQARYIRLTRDPAATQRSMQAHWERVMPEHPLEGQPMLGFAAWVDVNLRILDFARRLPRGRVLRLQRGGCSRWKVLGGCAAVARWLGAQICAPAALEAMAHPYSLAFRPPGNGGRAR